MYRLLIAMFITGLPAAHAAPDWLDIKGLAEVQVFANDSALSWYEGGFSKLRYDRDSVPVQPANIALHVDARLTDTLWLRSLSTLHQDPDVDTNLVELYLHYRPIPRGPLQLRARLGAFHPPVSLENRGLGWSSLYSITPSVINSWVGEEIRTVGGELELAWPGKARGSAHDFSLRAAVYGYNDAVGTLLAYRGWAAHDRQTGLGVRLPLIPEFPGQDRGFKPFLEIDHRPGYYLNGSWTWRRQVTLNLLHYDNRADPTARGHDQIAWDTRFDQVAIEIELPAEVRALGQYLTGETHVINTANGFRGDANYDAWYVLLSRRLGRHRLSARYERFSVSDLDPFRFGVHESDENGRSWLLAWRYQLTDPLQIGLEYLNSRSTRAARLEIEGQAAETEDQLLAHIRYSF